MKHQEHIIGVPASVISMDGKHLQISEFELNSADVIIAQRAKLEQDPSVRQVIPYLTIKCGEKFAVYARTSSGGESRLHGAVSMGYGGHIDIQDLIFDDKSIVDLDATIRQAAMREFEEEIRIDGSNAIERFDILEQRIVSSENEVDSVHMGVVAIVELRNEMIYSNEDQIEILGFKTPKEILEYEAIENWTRGLAQYYS